MVENWDFCIEAFVNLNKLKTHPSQMELKLRMNDKPCEMDVYMHQQRNLILGRSSAQKHYSICI